MINEYCGGLSDTLSQLVYYGIIKEEDAQCFRVESSIESAAYILVVAAILLAFLNTFVIKAVSQFFRDKEALARSQDTCECPSIEEDDISDITKKITPAPVLFTDRFRWLLCREDVMQSRWQSTSEDVADDDDETSLNFVPLPRTEIIENARLDESNEEICVDSEEVFVDEGDEGLFVGDESKESVKTVDDEDHGAAFDIPTLASVSSEESDSGSSPGDWPSILFKKKLDE